MQNKILLLLMVALSPTLVAQYVPSTVDRQAVTADADGVVVMPENFFEANNLAGQTAPIVDVADNAAKLALEDIQAGQRVRITGEGGRIEMYLGEGAPVGFTIAAGDFPNIVAGDYYLSNYTTSATGGELAFWARDPEADPALSEFDVFIMHANSSVAAGVQEFDGFFISYYYSTTSGHSAPYDVSSGDWETENNAEAGDYEFELIPSGPESDANWVTLISGGRRYPVFQIDVPYGSGFTDMELKASISNFTGATIEDKIVYYYHSPDPDLAQSIYGAKPLVWFTRSGSDTIVHRQQPDDDSIYSTLTDADSEVGSIYVIVRGDDEWLYPGNPDLLWGYVLFDGIGPVEDGATPGRQIWRAIRPVEWITPAEIPSFLEQ